MSAEDCSAAMRWAVRLARADIPSFPCLANKAPATPRGFKDASANPAELARLWRSYPGPLLGLPTGPSSGLDALDIDPRHGGDKWWQANRDRMPATRIQETRSGGLHILFKATPTVRNSESRIAPGVDTRGMGGYIVWWHAVGCRLRYPGPVAPWPDWLLAAYRSAVTPPPPVRTLPPLTTENASIVIAQARTMIARALYRLASAPAGQRHYHLRAAACTLGGLIDVAGITEQEAATRLVEAALSAGGEDARNAEATALWGLRRGRQSPLTAGGRR